MNKKYKITTAVVIIAILAVVGGLVFFSLREPEKEKKAEPTPVPTQAADISGIRSAGTLQAMITAVDLDSSSITLMSLADGEEQEFVYTGATSVYTKYGRMIHVLQLKPGDFVTVSYDEESRLISIKGSETVWSYKNIFNMIIHKSPPLLLSINNRINDKTNKNNATNNQNRFPQQLKTPA